MELQRKVDEKLALWLKGTEVLYLKGARQVGKTHSLETFLKPRFKHFIEINLALNSSLIPSFTKMFRRWSCFLKEKIMMFHGSHNIL